MAYELDGIMQIEYDELQKLVDRKSELAPIIIDVRELEEYNEGHIPTVPLLPMHSIPPVIEHLDKDKEYIFVCRSGSRSQHVALYLKQNGFDKVNNYAGGMLGWEGPIATGEENVVKEISDLYK
ncbi:rhodanese-like domain-containing protein [Bacillus sp. FJAT-45350]|uniref:rhodanese-like domain-containing protein n=1 Tax=Bacillus sp. FJAT-45350 TaxID=2011014 RepID=UPI000BB6DB02|nr:rhodanese-like domain-containing protein [Bacillus sp. FJAT-45350]